MSALSPLKHGCQLTYGEAAQFERCDVWSEVQVALVVFPEQGRLRWNRLYGSDVDDILDCGIVDVGKEYIPGDYGALLERLEGQRGREQDVSALSDLEGLDRVAACQCAVSQASDVSPYSYLHALRRSEVVFDEVHERADVTHLSSTDCEISEEEHQ